MIIVPIDKSVADKFVSRKHYSRNPSIFWKGFGLIEDGYVQGVVVYGQPSPPIQKHAFKERDFRLYELSRLVIQTPSANAASFLVGNSLQMLEPKPCAVISYADTAHDHCGIVYQATNWIYTGATRSHDRLYLVDGKKVHPMTLREQGITKPVEWAKEHNVKSIKPCDKHRYFFLVGDKRWKKVALSNLRYPVVIPYPKCDKVTYDDGPILKIRHKVK